MGNENRENNETTRNLQWGEHNTNLKDENFIDRMPKKISENSELTAKVDQASIASTVEEPGRNRPGTREGESS